MKLRGMVGAVTPEMPKPSRWRRLLALSFIGLASLGAFTVKPAAAQDTGIPRAWGLAIRAAGAIWRSFFDRFLERVSVKDFGALGDGVTDDTASCQVALNAAKFVFIPSGTYKLTTALTLNTGQRLYGAGYQNSILSITGAIKGLVYAPGSLTESGIVLSDFRIIGSASALNLIDITRGAWGRMSNLNVRNTSQSGIKMSDNCIGWLVDHCLIEDCDSYGIEFENKSSVNTILACQYNRNTITATAFIALDGVTQTTIIGCNMNGGNGASFFLYLKGAGTSYTAVEQCYAEAITNPAIANQAAAVVTGLRVANCNFASTNSVLIDLSAAGAHSGIEIVNLRGAAVVGGKYAFNPGRATSFSYKWGNLAGGTGVVGHIGINAVELLETATKRIGAKIDNFSETVSGATPALNLIYDVHYMGNGGATNVTEFSGGLVGARTLIFTTNGNTTLVHDVNKLRLQGAANIVMTTNDCIEIICVAVGAPNLWMQVR